MEDVSRLDRIIRDMEALQKEANGIFDAHLDTLLCNAKPGTSYGAVRYQALGRPAGGQINYVKALQHLRSKYLKG